MTGGTTKWTRDLASGHAYVILNADEYKLNGKSTRIVKLRNPWARTKFKGAYSEGSDEYKKLDAYFKRESIDNHGEGGKFYMEWSTFRKAINSIDVAYG